MGFPQCTNAYYLLIQLDNDLTPVFHLLETQIDESNKSSTDSTTDANQAVRFNRINISHMQIGEDKYSPNLFDAGKVLENMVNYSQCIEGRSLRKSGNVKLLPLTPSSLPSFSSLVDDVFEHNLSSSTTENQLLPPPSLVSNHLNSYQVGAEGVSGTVCPPELDGNFMHSDINLSEVKPGVSLNSDLLSNLKHFKCANAISSSGTTQISFMSSNYHTGHDLGSLRSPGGHSIVHGGESLQPVSSYGQGGTFYIFFLTRDFSLSEIQGAICLCRYLIKAIALVVMLLDTLQFWEISPVCNLEGLLGNDLFQSFY